MTVQDDLPLQRDFDKAKAAYDMWASSHDGCEEYGWPEFHSLSTDEIDRWLAFAPRVMMHESTFTHPVLADVEKYGHLIAPSMWDWDEASHPMSKPNPKAPTPEEMPTNAFDLRVPGPLTKRQVVMNYLLEAIERVKRSVKDL